MSPRLKSFDYAGGYAYFLTMVTRARRPAFTDALTVDRARGALRRSLEKHGFDVLAYCFMPDHLHLLVTGSPGASLKEFVRHFKQASSFEYKHRCGSELWQISYYDRVLRPDESLSSFAAYIWANPVKGGLAEEPRGYPFSGPKDLLEA